MHHLGQWAVFIALLVRNGYTAVLPNPSLESRPSEAARHGLAGASPTIVAAQPMAARLSVPAQLER
jgi:hypothetical protein